MPRIFAKENRPYCCEETLHNQVLQLPREGRIPKKLEHTKLTYPQDGHTIEHTVLERALQDQVANVETKREQGHTSERRKKNGNEEKPPAPVETKYPAVGTRRVTTSGQCPVMPQNNVSATIFLLFCTEPYLIQTIKKARTRN